MSSSTSTRFTERVWRVAAPSAAAVIVCAFGGPPWSLAASVLFAALVAELVVVRRVRASSELVGDAVQRLDLVAKSTSFAVVVTNRRGETEWANDAMLQLTGYSLEEMRGRKPGALLQGPGTDRTVVRKIGDAIRAGRGFKGEIVNRSKAGRDYRVSIEIEPLRRETGELVGFMSIQTDVTERHRLEVELKEMSQRALIEAQRLELAFSGADVGLWDWDPRSGDLVVNDAWAEALGRKVSEMSCTTDDWATLLHPDDKPQAFGALAAHFSGDAPIYEATFRMQHADGGWRWMHARGKVFERDGAGEPSRVVGVQMDRTDEVERGLLLERLRSDAESANRSKSEFLANMSHEIRTPLTAILGYADLMRDGSDPEHFAEVLDTIESAGQHLLTLINDILDLSKVEADRLTIEPVEVDLAALLGDVLGLTRTRTDPKGVELLARVVGRVPARAFMDPTRIRQVLVNLLGNAAKFTDEGRVELRVTAGDMLRFEVEDTGPGLSAEQLVELFEPFVQADGSVTRRFGGSGLGLSISRRLARLMGGDVTVEWSEPGVGSRFVFELPLSESEGAPRLELEQHSGSSIRSEGARSGARRIDARVLLVEDGPVNQRLIATVLQRAGAEVEVASDGAEALAVFDAAVDTGREFDLVVSDMQMPVMDGYQLARTLRERGVATPILALTAHAMSEDRAVCLEAGCDDYATKPIDRAALIGACADLVAGRERRAV